MSRIAFAASRSTAPVADPTRAPRLRGQHSLTARPTATNARCTTERLVDRTFAACSGMDDDPQGKDALGSHGSRGLERLPVD